MRGTWFWFDDKLDQYVPFNESLANSIDAWFEEEKAKAYDLERHNRNQIETICVHAEKDIAFKRTNDSAGPQQYRFVVRRDNYYGREGDYHDDGRVDKTISRDDGKVNPELKGMIIQNNRTSSLPSSSSSSSSSFFSSLSMTASSQEPTVHVHGEQNSTKVVDVVGGNVRIKAQNSMDNIHCAAEKEHEKPSSLLTEIDGRDQNGDLKGRTTKALPDSIEDERMHGSKDGRTGSGIYEILREVVNSSSSSSDELSAKRRSSGGHSNMRETSQYPHIIEDGFSMTMQALPGTLFEAVYHVQRGIEMEETDDDKERQKPVDHLCLVVHGIGETMFSKKRVSGVKSFKESVDAIRKLTTEQRIAIEKQDGVPSERRVEFLTVEWHGIVHSNEFNLTRDIDSVTLSGLKIFRDIANEIIIDIIVYMTPNFRERILTSVVHELNKIYTLFCKYNPAFVAHGGKCSLIGHSLGSVILFDVLTQQVKIPSTLSHLDQSALSSGWLSNLTSPFIETLGSSSPVASAPERTQSEEQNEYDSKMASGAADLHVDASYNFAQLEFQPHSFLAMGSPIAFFVSIRKNARRDDGTIEESWKRGPDSKESLGVMGPKFKLRTCKNFYNLFHPHDPVAYRMEPLLYLSLKDVPPALVPHHDGLVRFNYKLTKLGTKIQDTVSKLFNPEHWSANTLGDSLNKLVTDDSYQDLIQLFPDGYPDIMLNDRMRVDYILQENPIEGFSEYLSSVGGHTNYFDLPDVARFLVVHVAQLSPQHASKTSKFIPIVKKYEERVFENNSITSPV